MFLKTKGTTGDKEGYFVMINTFTNKREDRNHKIISTGAKKKYLTKFNIYSQ